MKLYHGSRTGGFSVLEPRIADHGGPYVYFSTIEVVAALYLCNAVERPYYWFPYGFDQNHPGIPVYDELYANDLREVSEGVSGWIYYVDREWYYGAIRRYMQEKRMDLTPDCSYARFIQDKFPFVWEQFIRKK